MLDSINLTPPSKWFAFGRLPLSPLQKTSGRRDLQLKIDVMPAKMNLLLRLLAVNTLIFKNSGQSAEEE